jgi:hypothetical protein
MFNSLENAWNTSPSAFGQMRHSTATVIPSSPPRNTTTFTSPLNDTFINQSLQPVPHGHGQNPYSAQPHSVPNSGATDTTCFNNITQQQQDLGSNRIDMSPQVQAEYLQHPQQQPSISSAAVTRIDTSNSTAPRDATIRRMYGTRRVIVGDDDQEGSRYDRSDHDDSNDLPCQNCARDLHARCLKSSGTTATSTVLLIVLLIVCVVGTWLCLLRQKRRMHRLDRLVHYLLGLNRMSL